MAGHEQIDLATMVFIIRQAFVRLCARNVRKTTRHKAVHRLAVLKQAIHTLVFSGVFLPDGTFVPLPKLATEPFLKRWEHEVFKRLLAQGKITAEIVANSDAEIPGEVRKELMDLKITNRAKDLFIEQLQKERESMLREVISGSHRIGELEQKLLQLEAPVDQNARIETKSVTDREADRLGDARL